jgi:ribosomal protein S18 acetylase RimI-like enzyme
MPPPLAAAAGLGISYRPMTDGDLPFLAALYAAIRAEEVAASGWPGETQRQFLAQQFGAQHHHYVTYYPDAERLVIERAGVPIGRLYVEEWTREFRIIDIALVPAEQGRGIGAAILRDALAWAGGRGKAVSIHVEKNNPAMHLYRRLGFATVEDKGVYDLLEWRPAAPGGSEGKASS